MGMPPSKNTPAPAFPALDLGPLPVARINAALGTELAPGSVRLSRQAHRHIAQDHPADYAVVLPLLRGGLIQRFTFAGQAPGHGGNFELVARIGRPDGTAALVAIGLEPDADGSYRVRSCYLIPGRTVEERRRAGRLRIPPPE